MAYEIETKVLGIDKDELIQKIVSLGAEKTQETRLTVDWFRLKGVKDGEDPWFLRIRSNSEGKYEVTWKAKSHVSGITKVQEEINFFIQEPEKLTNFFEKLGLEKYAHQQKDRTSFQFKNYIFDIDEYPGVPAYLEIESDSEENIKSMMQTLKLENHTTYQKGERFLIQDVYKLNWYNMKF